MLAAVETTSGSAVQPPQPSLASAAATTSALFQDMVDHAINSQENVEAHFLLQEDHIRRRVALLDTMHQAITNVRHCLEVQHHDCRSAISKARSNLKLLQSEKSKMMNFRATSTLAMEERNVDTMLREVDGDLATATTLLRSLTAEKARVEEEDAQVEAHIDEMYREQRRVEQSTRTAAVSLAKLEETCRFLRARSDDIADWGHKLELRSTELNTRQHLLHLQLRELEAEESRVGIAYNREGSFGGGSVCHSITQREVMDDHAMHIKHDLKREELDFDEMEEEPEDWIASAQDLLEEMHQEEGFG